MDLAAAGDINGDGLEDLVLTALDGVVEVHFGTAGLGSTAEETSLGDTFDAAGVTAMAVGDVTGDGVDDVVLLIDSSLYVLIGGGNWAAVGRSLADAVIITTADLGDTFFLADYDGDGRKDAFIQSAQDSDRTIVINAGALINGESGNWINDNTPHGLGHGGFSCALQSDPGLSPANHGLIWIMFFAILTCLGIFCSLPIHKGRCILPRC
jgi:hypothetical protein